MFFQGCVGKSETLSFGWHAIFMAGFKRLLACGAAKLVPAVNYEEKYHAWASELRLSPKHVKQAVKLFRKPLLHVLDSLHGVLTSVAFPRLFAATQVKLINQALMDVVLGR